MLANLVLEQSPLTGLQLAAFLLYAHMAERVRQRKRQRKQAALVCLPLPAALRKAYKDTNPILGSPPL